VWVGYDNSRGKQTLGHGQTGGRVALPIAESIIQAAWASHAAKAPLPSPSAEAARELRAIPIEVNSGAIVSGRSPDAFQEYFRLDAQRRLLDTRYTLVDRRRAAQRSEIPPMPAELERRAPAPRQNVLPVGPERRMRGSRDVFGLLR